MREVDKSKGPLCVGFFFPACLKISGYTRAAVVRQYWEPRVGDRPTYPVPTSQSNHFSHLIFTPTPCSPLSRRSSPTGIVYGYELGITNALQ